MGWVVNEPHPGHFTPENDPAPLVSLGWVGLGTCLDGFESKLSPTNQIYGLMPCILRSSLILYSTYSSLPEVSQFFRLFSCRYFSSPTVAYFIVLHLTFQINISEEQKLRTRLLGNFPAILDTSTVFGPSYNSQNNLIISTCTSSHDQLFPYPLFKMRPIQ